MFFFNQLAFTSCSLDVYLEQVCAWKSPRWAQKPVIKLVCIQQLTSTQNIGKFGSGQIEYPKNQRSPLEILQIEYSQIVKFRIDILLTFDSICMRYSICWIFWMFEGGPRNLFFRPPGFWSEYSKCQSSTITTISILGFPCRLATSQ